MLRRGDGTGRAGTPNMACAMETYHGGLQCCKHAWFLTDAAQAPRVPPAVDTYFLKWRFYFQEYTPADAAATPPRTATAASHRHLHHFVFLIDDAVNDYEEDSAPAWSKWRLGGAIAGHQGLIRLHLKASDCPQHS